MIRNHFFSCSNVGCKDCGVSELFTILNSTLRNQDTYCLLHPFPPVSGMTPGRLIFPFINVFHGIFKCAYSGSSLTRQIMWRRVMGREMLWCFLSQSGLFPLFLNNFLICIGHIYPVVYSCAYYGRTEKWCVPLQGQHWWCNQVSSTSPCSTPFF